MLTVGRGWNTPEDVQRILALKDRKEAGKPRQHKVYTCRMLPIIMKTTNPSVFNESA